MITRRPARFAALVTAIAALLVIDGLVPPPVSAQILGAAERAAARAAQRQALRRASKQASTRVPMRVSKRTPAARASSAAKDLELGKYSAALCGRIHRCPLPREFAKTFTGGSYKAMKLAKNTTLYRNYSTTQFRFGDPAKSFSYWSRSRARGTQAIIDSAIPVRANGNLAQRQVAIVVPSGTVVYEGTAAGLRQEGRQVGGGSQVVIRRINSAWERH